MRKSEIDLKTQEIRHATEILKQQGAQKIKSLDQSTLDAFVADRNRNSIYPGVRAAQDAVDKEVFKNNT